MSKDFLDVVRIEIENDIALTEHAGKFGDVAVLFVHLVRQVDHVYIVIFSAWQKCSDHAQSRRTGYLIKWFRVLPLNIVRSC